MDMDKSDEYLNLPDTMENISIDDIIEENSNIARKRTSEDQVINENGKELLQLCRTNNLYILNGRVRPEVEGSFTCHTARGNSVVDYVIAGERLVQFADSFHINDPSPLSDHNIVSASFKFVRHVINDTARERNCPSYKWKEEHKSLYMDNLNSPHVSNQLGILRDNLTTYSDINSLENNVNILSDVILTAAAPCKVNHSHRSHCKTVVSAPWYDKECSTNRVEYNKWRNAYNKSRDVDDKSRDVDDKVKRDEARATYRSVCKKKCYTNDINETKQLYVDKRTNPKAYWKHVVVHKPKEKECVTLACFKEHFREICSSAEQQVISIDHNYKVFDPILDRNFTTKEIEKGIKHLKYGKSPGDDLILSEFITHGNEHYKHILAELFNQLYVNGYFPSKWSTGVIVPIYKKGDQYNPSNYRGITLTCTLRKLFTYILNERLLQFLSFHSLSSECQFAYKPGYSTIDAVYVLQSIIALNMVKSDTHCAFIDFSKAFDKIDRLILYNKMMKCGISSMMLQMIVNMYSKIRSKIKTSEGFTDAFPLDIGLLQGECLSPSLFSMCIDDIVAHMHTVDKMGVCVNGTKITVLKYADDLVLLASSADALQAGLEALESYCITNKLTVNTGKSKVMCFARKAPEHLPKLYYNKEVLEWVNQFKYLGVTFSSRNTFTDGLDLLCHQAQKAQALVDLHVLKHKTVSVKYIIDLFDTLVKPVLTYGSAVYGIQNCMVVETFYLKFLKKILKVKTSTNTCSMNSPSANQY